MLGGRPAQGPDPAIASRLVVQPPAAVRGSVLPLADPAAAMAEAEAAGLPSELLARFGATVRQTHRRANVIVLDVPPERQPALIEALSARGVAAWPRPHRSSSRRRSPRTVEPRTRCSPRCPGRARRTST